MKIIEYCEETERVIAYFGNDFSEYLSNTHYQRACAFNLPLSIISLTTVGTYHVYWRAY